MGGARGRPAQGPNGPKRSVNRERRNNGSLWAALLPADVLHDLVFALTRDVVPCRAAGRAHSVRGGWRERALVHCKGDDSGGECAQRFLLLPSRACPPTPTRPPFPPEKMMVGRCHAESSAILRRMKNLMCAPRRAMKAAAAQAGHAAGEQRHKSVKHGRLEQAGAGGCAVRRPGSGWPRASPAPHRPAPPTHACQG